MQRKQKPLFFRGFTVALEKAKQGMGNNRALHFVSLASPFQKSTLKSQQIVKES